MRACDAERRASRGHTRVRADSDEFKMSTARLTEVERRSLEHALSIHRAAAIGITGEGRFQDKLAKIRYTHGEVGYLVYGWRDGWQRKRTGRRVSMAR